MGTAGAVVVILIIIAAGVFAARAKKKREQQPVQAEAVTPNDAVGSMNTEDWPFAQSPTTAVIILRPIMEGRAAVLHVTHDADDDGWQFLTLDDAREEDAMLVSLEQVVRLDPSLKVLADLPAGWRAWRQTKADPWRREPNT